MTGPGDDRDDEELAALLADLERTLTELRSAIDADVRGGNGTTPDDRRRPRRPPTPGEILRFTEEYTIPTLIALLEATVRSLELLRAVLRLAGPGATTAERLRERSRADDAPDVATLRDALGDLRAALTGADLPADSEAGSVLADARALTEEIDDRLADASARDGRPDRPASRGRGSARGDRAARERRRDRERSGAAGVDIDVREEGDAGDVNVDEELASIKESMGKRGEAAGTGDATEDGGGGEDDGS